MSNTKNFKDNGECVALATRICGELNVSAPAISWTRTRNGYYHYAKRQISVGEKCWRGTEAALLHELAHHVDRARRNFKFDSPPHGPKFIKALEDVVVAANGNVRSYPWGTEYKNIIRIAKKRGWLSA